MKTIGILGGMSFESTVHYYERINRQVNERLGGLSSARMLLYNVDFAQIRGMMLAGAWDEIGRELSDAATRLEQAGAECMVIATNTIHKVAEQIQRAVSIPLLHIADSAADACKAGGIRRVGLLGTRYVMEDGFFAQRLMENGVDAFVPSDAGDRESVDRIIFEELCKGQVLPEAREAYVRIVNAMRLQYGIDGLMLGCTEIEMLLKPGDVPLPMIDTLQAHVDAIVRFAISG